MRKISCLFIKNQDYIINISTDKYKDKILKEKQMIEDKKKEFDEIKKNNDLKNKENKSCSCC